MLLDNRNIGKFAIEHHNIKPIDCMLTEIKTDEIKTILIVNVLDNEINTDTVEFYNDITKEALFYQAGRGALGGGIRLDFYKENKVKSACKFCEIEDRFEAVKEVIENYMQDKGNAVFAIIKINGKTPRELFSEKFLEKMYSTMYNRLKGKHICHICGNTEQAYNTAAFKFYTNDKEVYGNVEEKDKSGIVICKDCLDYIIVGKKYTEEYLTSFWLGNKVMFLPHEYNEITAGIYENSNLDENGEQTKFIDNIRNNEEYVLELIGKENLKTETDIVFYMNDGNKTFYIYHVIKSLLPSRFNFLSKTLKEYKLKLFAAIKYATAIKVGVKDVETTTKEKIKFVDAVFTGRKLDRNIFFKRVMSVYKINYIQGKHKENYCIYNINRIYNFLVRCGCLKGGWNVMSSYKDYKELFDKNTEYFDSNEKKAWFIIGKCYNLMNFYMKNYNKVKSDNEYETFDKTSLDKNFFFARKFEFKDFIYFANTLTDKANKYSSNTVKFRELMCEAKELMAQREGKLSFDEAKYLFFWGMDSYFQKDGE